MGEVSTIGLDIAKHVFQAHGADASGAVVFRKKLTRAKLLAFFAAQPRCVVAMEACGGAHHWARELGALGHDGPADPAGLREAVREAAEERRGRCRGDLRGGAAADDAVRAGEERGAAGERRGVPGARPAGAPAHPAHQRAARPPGRVRLGRAARASAMSSALIARIEDPACELAAERARRCLQVMVDSLHGAGRADRRARSRDRPARQGGSESRAG